MYRHLLVPIDASDLSTVTIGRAVEFALALGARITFFHALPDYASSIVFMGDADIIRMTSPEDYAYSFEGRARELLTKAESAALSRGVPCSSATANAVGDAPAAIVAAAREAGCDLIFMASHGRSSKIGMMLGSQTLKVLVNSEIPVLVSATSDPEVPAQAAGILRDEHRSLVAVLHACLHLTKRAGDGVAGIDPALLKAMVHYLKNFPLALHHPKENEYLFARLRERTSQFDADLDELERQHQRDHALLSELETKANAYLAGQLDLSELDAAANAYARFMWEHMGREEGVIMPAAQRYLTEADWVEINAAFHEHSDPRFGGDTEAEFKRLFSQIVNLAPAE